MLVLKKPVFETLLRIVVLATVSMASIDAQSFVDDLLYTSSAEAQQNWNIRELTPFVQFTGGTIIVPTHPTGHGSEFDQLLLMDAKNVAIDLNSAGVEISFVARYFGSSDQSKCVQTFWPVQNPEVFDRAYPHSYRFRVCKAHDGTGYLEVDRIQSSVFDLVNLLRVQATFDTQFREYKVKHEPNGTIQAFEENIPKGTTSDTSFKAGTLGFGAGTDTLGKDTGVEIDRVSFTEEALPFLTVSIDIRPGGFPNSINLSSNGTVPVAIFSASTFDATTVNPLTVTLASSSVRLKGNGTAMASFEDVNRDGRLDLVVHVSTAALQLSATDIEAVLEGSTFGGMPIRGVDSIRVVP